MPPPYTHEPPAEVKKGLYRYIVRSPEGESECICFVVGTHEQTATSAQRLIDRLNQQYGAAPRGFRKFSLYPTPSND